MVKTSPSNAGAAGSIPGHRAEIPYALQLKTQNTETTEVTLNKFNKDSKNDQHTKKKKILKKNRIMG